MKKRIIFLFILSSFLFSTNADAQFNKWKKKLQNSSLVKKTQKAIKQVDPKAYVTKKINENFYLSSQLQNIKTSYYKLERSIDNNVNLYNNSNHKFENDFYTKKITDNQLDYLKLQNVNQHFPVIINYNNESFNLWKNQDFIIASGKEKMPINTDLEKIIQTGCWASQTRNLNSEYISNLRTLAKLNSEFYGYMLLFYDGCINIFNKVGNIGYGGITAEQLINQYSNSLGNGFSMSNTKSSFESYRSDLKEMQNISNRIYNGCNNFIKTKQNLDRTKTASYQDVQNSLIEFNTIAKDINSLADGVSTQKDVIRNTRKQLSELSDFYGISFIEDIGNLYKYLEDYYSKIEIGTRQHADNFAYYVNYINEQSLNSFKVSKQTFDNIANEQIQNDLPNIKYLLKIQSNITGSDFRNNPSDSYVQYLNKIKAQNAQMLTDKGIDFIQFGKSKSELLHNYKNFPIEQAERYYETSLAAIDKKQILGGKYSEKYLPTYKAGLNSVKDNDEFLKTLSNMDGDIDSYYKMAKTKNYLGGGILFGIIIIVSTILFMRKRKLSIG